MAGKARQTRPVVWCHPGCRCNQCRSRLAWSDTSSDHSTLDPPRPEESHRKKLGKFVDLSPACLGRGQGQDETGVLG